MGIVPTGSNVKRQVSYPSPVSASDRGNFSPKHNQNRIPS
jgi:hypothetical protein